MRVHIWAFSSKMYIFSFKNALYAGIWTRLNYYYSLLYIHFILFPLLCQSLDKECKPYLKITGQIRRSLAPTAGKSKPLWLKCMSEEYKKIAEYYFLHKRSSYEWWSCKILRFFKKLPLQTYDEAANSTLQKPNR